MKRIVINLILILGITCAFFACEEEKFALPEAKTELQNDVIKRTLGPNVAGLDLEFVYAIAMGYNTGRITSATVEASIAGAPGTFLEHRSFYTNSGGADVPVVIGEPSVTNGTRTEVTFTRDTVAASLRYFYKIPPEAKGQEVSFTFSATASTGETVSYQMGPYFIGKVDMALDLVMSDSANMYLSIEDMAVYDAAGAAGNPSKIDLVYLYRAIPGITFAHSLVAPSTNPEYLPGVSMPSGISNATKLVKVYGLRDRHLSRLQYGIYIDDIDFESIDFSKATDFGINMKVESGLWIETADGKYRAFVFVNKVDNNARQMTVSIKRYTM